MDGYEVPEKINKFHLNNDIQHFQYDRPFHKGPRDKDNEFKVYFLSNNSVKENITISRICYSKFINFNLSNFSDIMGGKIYI